MQNQEHFACFVVSESQNQKSGFKCAWFSCYHKSMQMYYCKLGSEIMRFKIGDPNVLSIPTFIHGGRKFAAPIFSHNRGVISKR